MYSTVITWLTTPITVKFFIKHNSSGDAEYGDTIDALCYPGAGEGLIVDIGGKEVKSSLQLYMTVAVKLQDVITFEGIEYDIKAVKRFYRAGKVDVLVVYL